MKEKNRFNLEIFLINILSPQVVSLMVDLLCGNVPLKYSNFIKPYFALDYKYLSIGNSIFYIILGYSFYIIYNSLNNIEDATLFYCYFIWLNFLSTILIYGIDLKLISIFIHIILIVYGIKCFISFYKIDIIASLMFLNCLIWSIYCIILKIFIYKLN